MEDEEGTVSVEITSAMVDAEIVNAMTVSKMINTIAGKDFTRGHIILALVMASAEHSHPGEIDQLSDTASLIYENSSAMDGSVQ